MEGQEDAEAAKEPLWLHNGVGSVLCEATLYSCGPDIVSTLLAHGADAQGTNEFGSTAQQIIDGLDRNSFLVRYSAEDRRRITKLLAEHRD